MLPAAPIPTLRSAEGPWSAHAAQWHLVGAPLRPSVEDVAIVAEHAAHLARARDDRAIRALILGVTPELATLPWPAETSLVGVDRSAAMIEAVWPRAGLPRSASVVRADWRELPLDAASCDIVVGDGVFAMLAHPDGGRVLAAQVHRVLAPGGRFVTRAFVAPERAESVEAVAADLRAGRIGSFHALKWRLAMALQPSPERGVRVADVWTAWREICPNGEALADDLGWDRAVVATIDAYRDGDGVYAFPTLAELRRILAERFVELECRVPRYELGARCPTLVLTAR
jgi:SAM-dependent methyltransferase